VLFLVAAGLGALVRAPVSGAAPRRPLPSFGEVAMVEVMEGR